MNSNNNLLYELYKLKLFGYKYINKSRIIKSNDIVLPNNINELYNRISNCNLCELSNISKSKLTHKNNINSNIAILVPHILNNIQYKILENMVKKYFNINIQEIIILNLIKCDINDNNISTTCYNTCKDYTIKQLQILKPKYIFSFGDVYKYIIDNKLTIGQKIIYNNSNLYYLEDLNYIVRNPSSIEKFENILNKIKNEMEKL